MDRQTGRPVWGREGHFVSAFSLMQACQHLLILRISLTCPLPQAHRDHGREPVDSQPITDLLDQLGTRQSLTNRYCRVGDPLPPKDKEDPQPHSSSIIRNSRRCSIIWSFMISWPCWYVGLFYRSCEFCLPQGFKALRSRVRLRRAYTHLTPCGTISILCLWSTSGVIGYTLASNTQTEDHTDEAYLNDATARCREPVYGRPMCWSSQRYSSMMCAKDMLL